jgi:hypothetical protein
MDKNFKEGGEVSYITYKNQEIMFEPIYNEYYVNDEQFETLEDAKRYIDKGTPMGSEMKDAYGKGFFEQGGDTIEGDKEQNEKCIKVFSDFVNEIVNVKYTFTDKKNKTLVFVLNEEPKMDTIEDINSFLDETYDNCKGIFADSTIKYDIKEQTKTLSLPLLNNNYGDGMNLFVDGGVTEDKHLVAKAIEFIVGYPIEKDSLVFEPTKVNFKYKGKNVSSSLSRKLINDVISTNIKSLQGRYADGGGVDEIKIGTKIKSSSNNYVVTKKSTFGWVMEAKNGDKLVKNEYELKQLIERGQLQLVDNKMSDGGGIPHEDEMFHLPLEMVVYVPSTKDVDKVISVDEMDKRVNEVKEYVASRFGGYSSADKLGGFVDSNGKLVNEDVVQVVSFSTKEAFESNKEELVNQLSKWGKEWGQEAIGFEFEGDLYYVPQEGDLIKKTKKD